MSISDVLDNNKKWAKEMTDADADYFSKLANQQAPEYFWIGCSDSRVPATQLLGLDPGEVFVQRNVGNLAMHGDMNCMTALEFAVNALKVKHVIVCGHYNCGAMKGALSFPDKTPGIVNMWISEIKDTRNRHAELLGGLQGQAQVDRLCELNAIRQVFNVCSSPAVQGAWDEGRELSVHGLAYSVGDGLLKELTKPITGYNTLVEAKEAAEHPGLLIFEDTSGPDKEWKDKQLQADIAEEVKKTVFFEHGERGVIVNNALPACKPGCPCHTPKVQPFVRTAPKRTMRRPMSSSASARMMGRVTPRAAAANVAVKSARLAMI